VEVAAVEVVDATVLASVEAENLVIRNFIK
jgi:hypothetical protein